MFKDRLLTDDRQIAPCFLAADMPQQLYAIHVWHHHILQAKRITRIFGGAAPSPLSRHTNGAKKHKSTPRLAHRENEAEGFRRVPPEHLQCLHTAPSFSDCSGSFHRSGLRSGGPGGSPTDRQTWYRAKHAKENS